MHLPHLASRLYGAPLLLARSKLDILLAVLGERIDWPASDLALPSVPVRSPMPNPTGIAVIPMVGTLVRRTVGLEAASGLTSYGELAAQLDAALADPGIAGILLEVDSPGGEAGGVFDLAQRIRAADSLKPVWAIASDAAYSAAYALASAASRLYVTQTGGVGSIGVIAMHVDQSVRDANAGYRYTAVTAGEHKDDLSPHAPLSSDAQARLQAEVDRLYGLFVEQVATMRGLDPAAVRATEADLYFGSAAIDAGLADCTGSFEQALADFQTFLAVRPHLPVGRLPGVPASFRTASHPQEISMSDSQPLPSATKVADDPVPPSDGVAAPESAAVTDVPSAAAATASYADAVAIAELCQLAGQPQRIAAFLAAGTRTDEVRRALLASRAETPEIASTIHPDATPSATAQGVTHSPLLRAVHKLIGKE